MVDPDKRTDGAAPSHVHIEEKKKTSWLPWLLLALGLLALLFALSRCNDRDEAAVIVPTGAPTADPTGNTSEVVGQTPNAAGATALAGTSTLGTYLAGTEAAPRSFTFEKLTFDTSSSEVRAADAVEIDQIAGVLGQYPNTRVRIAGYADARGPDAANQTLGKARADAVKAALVAKNVAAERIETVSGGENDPVDSNATASGQAENRRTELVVTQR
jgi:outer membrane protein OmpA-like peptidoglycan-associated protein